MKYAKSKYRLMAPGPVQVAPKVLEKICEPMVHHRTPEFQKILESVLSNLPRYFLTKQPVMMLPSTGSGGMEAAIVNCFSPGDKVISIVSGKFGQRWAHMAETYDLNVHRIEVEWGQAVDIKIVRSALAEHSDAKGLLTQACETSTATWQPIKAISKITRTSDVLLVVDGITAVGCTHLPMDTWGIDVLVGGSQKAFGLPAGLSFVAMSEKAWAANKNAKCPRYYFDLKKERQANEKMQTHFSSVVPLIKGLDLVVQDALDKGMDHMVMRTSHLAECTRKAATAFGMNVFSGCPSPSVTALLPPEGIDAGQLRTYLEESYQLTVMGGQDSLKGKIIRIGHMGDISNEDQLATIESIGMALIELGASLTEEKVNEVLDQSEDYLKMCSNV